MRPKATPLSVAVFAMLGILLASCQPAEREVPEPREPGTQEEFPAGPPPPPKIIVDPNAPGKMSAAEEHSEASGDEAAAGTETTHHRYWFLAEENDPKGSKAVKNKSWKHSGIHRMNKHYIGKITAFKAIDPNGQAQDINKMVVRLQNGTEIVALRETGRRGAKDRIKWKLDKKDAEGRGRKLGGPKWSKEGLPAEFDGAITGIEVEWSAGGTGSTGKAWAVMD